MDDTISRQVAIDAILTEVDEIDMPNVESRWWNMGMMRASKILEHLPSAQKKGKWIDYPITDECFQCSRCGVLRMGKSSYCSNCGADMRERKEDEKRTDH